MRQLKPDDGALFTHVKGATYAYSLRADTKYVKTCGTGINDIERGEIKQGNGKWKINCKYKIIFVKI